MQVEFVAVPYADFEAKYLSAFASRENAPDLFIGVVSFWAGAANVADPMPEALAKRLETEVVDAVKPGYKMNGKWMGLSDAGIPGFGPMLIYNPDDFIEVGLDPKKPPATMDELLEYSRKLVKRDADGNITRSGCAMRYDGALGLGIATKFFPFLHSFGGQMFDPATGKSEGIANSPETIEAVEYVTNYTQGEKLASTTLGVPEVQFGQRKASMIFREGHMIGWIPTNYPGVNFEFAPVPKARKVGMGLTGLSEWAPLVYKFGPNKDAAWNLLDKVVYTAEGELIAASAPGQPGCLHIQGKLGNPVHEGPQGLRGPAVRVGQRPGHRLHAREDGQAGRPVRAGRPGVHAGQEEAQGSHGCRRGRHGENPEELTSSHSDCRCDVGVASHQLLALPLSAAAKKGRSIPGHRLFG